jgi:hypothetical protein
VSAVDADRENEREKRIRARNRALFIVLAVLAALFYVIAMVRMKGLGP